MSLPPGTRLGAYEILGPLGAGGRYLACQANESGHFEICVRTFPDPHGGKWQLSRGRVPSVSASESNAPVMVIESWRAKRTRQ
jgi:hypothetical protein